MERTLTKQPMKVLAVRMLPRQNDIVIEACRIEGMSRSEFVRRSTLDLAKRILRRAEREKQS